MASSLRYFGAVLLLGVVAVAGLLSSSVAASSSKRPFYMYLNVDIKNWSDICPEIRHMVDNGVTHVILSFWLFERGSVDSIKVWSDMPEEKKTECLNYVHSKGAKLLMACGGATEDPYRYDARAYGMAVAEETMRLNLDGIDFDLEQLPPHFDQTPKYNWIVTVTRAAREVFNGNGLTGMEVTHAPQAPYLTSWGGSRKGYIAVMKELGDDVDAYLVQWYNQESCKYSTYESIFERTETSCWSSGSTWTEMKEALGADSALVDKLVVGKPATHKCVYSTGLVAPESLAAFVCRAEEELGYRAGIMAWVYRGRDLPQETGRFLSAIGGDMCVSPATTTKKPGPLDGGCYQDESWWESDCKSSKLCRLVEGIKSEDACTSSNASLPAPMWASSEMECRAKNPRCAIPVPDSNAHFPEKKDGEHGEESDFHVAMFPEKKDGEDGEHGCFVSSTWWESSCNSSNLCIYQGSQNSESSCIASGLPLATWAADEAACRKAMKGRGCSQ